AQSERTWAVEQVLMPALLRQVHRFRPNVKALTGSELFSIGFSFWLYATSSSDRTDILLASPAISEEDKAKLRAGKNSVTLPPPSGRARCRAAAVRYPTGCARRPPPPPCPQGAGGGPRRRARALKCGHPPPPPAPPPSPPRSTLRRGPSPTSRCSAARSARCCL